MSDTIDLCGSCFALEDLSVSIKLAADGAPFEHAVYMLLLTLSCCRARGSRPKADIFSLKRVGSCGRFDRRSAIYTDMVWRCRFGAMSSGGRGLASGTEKNSRSRRDYRPTVEGLEALRLLSSATQAHALTDVAASTIRRWTRCLSATRRGPGRVDGDLGRSPRSDRACRTIEHARL